MKHVSPTPSARPAIWLFLVLGTFGCRPPAPNRVDELPLDSPYQVEYPLFEDNVKLLVPERVGEFALTESASAFASLPALETWNAFFKAADGRQIQLRLQRCATPEVAYAQIVGDRLASPSVRAVHFEPAMSKGKIAGTLAKAHYFNGVKGIEADVVWFTRGNVAFVIGSPDGVHAETFYRDFDAILAY
jgi:hypothetical protein